MGRQAERELQKLREGREKILASMMRAEAAGNSAGLPYMQMLLRKSLVPLAERIDQDLTAAHAIVNGKNVNKAGAYKKFATYLGGMDSRVVALRALQAALECLVASGAADDPQPIKRIVARQAGKAVYYEYMMQHFSDLAPPLFNSLTREYSRSMTTDEAHLIKAFRSSYQSNGYTWPLWEFGTIEHVGHYLVTQMQAVGFMEVWNQTDRKEGRANVQQYVRLDQDLRYASLDLMDQVANLPRATGPLVEPPLPWDASTNTAGGFHTKEMQRLLAYAVQGRGMRPVSDSTIEAINNLQATEWQINRKVLDIVDEASRLFDFGDVVSPIRTPKPERVETEDQEEIKAYKKAAHLWYTERAHRAAKHLRVTKAVREARELRDEDCIWFAYYGDFRGRLYARASGVSPQGTDLEKGLLRFSRGKRVPANDTAALRWWMIHGANKFGVDKVSYDDRVAWVTSHWEDIYRSATEPLDYRWWTQADCPVQFLAWCLEAKDRRDNPETWVSHLPVSLDGTCNGLQNFSALLRDSIGGKAVNLTPGAKPNDIYADVAAEATRILLAAEPHKLRDAWLAHGLNRKVTKRPTMTLPYGCTRYACAQFIVEDYLEKVQPGEFDKADYGDAGNFLSHVVWEAIGKVVIKAREAMDWLKGWAKFCVQNNIPVRWTTPNGLVVKSQYPTFKPLQIQSIAFAKSRCLLYRGDYDKLDAVKCANAVAPNFVHSMDACHLARVVNTATRMGFSVAAIHDDYGVHAADTQEFTRVIREQFVKLYEDSDMLQEMASNSGYDVPPPSRGSLVLQDVLQSPYFFG